MADDQTNGANNDASPPNKKQNSRKPVRIWADGCFDMMHYGHANALRQARELGDVLVVGVHSDAEVLRNKGPPVMNEAERYAAVRACKWVDEVAEDAPYNTSLEWLDRYNIDFCVHGDDLVTDANGNDCYDEVKKAGRFRVVKRTQGVSTTDLVGRMLLLTKDHLPIEVRRSKPSTDDDKQQSPTNKIAMVRNQSPYTGVSNFVPTTQTLVQFASGSRAPTSEDKIVYIAGAFDVFHVGHVDALMKAREFGTFLIVGIHDDATVNYHKGGNLPLMNLHERVLGVLQCRCVDDVITGAPWKITKSLIETLNISVVVQGSVSDYPDEESDPYSVPRQMGILTTFSSPSSLTTTGIVDRILTHRAKYLERNAKKEKKEVAEYERDMSKGVPDEQQAKTAVAAEQNGKEHA